MVFVGLFLLAIIVALIIAYQGTKVTIPEGKMGFLIEWKKEPRLLEPGAHRIHYHQKEFLHEYSLGVTRGSTWRSEIPAARDMIQTPHVEVFYRISDPERYADDMYARIMNKSHRRSPSGAVAEVLNETFKEADFYDRDKGWLHIVDKAKEPARERLEERGLELLYIYVRDADSISDEEMSRETDRIHEALVEEHEGPKGHDN